MNRQLSHNAETHKEKSSMKELFYFSFADLMVRVDYQKEANSLRYATHREMTLSERAIVDQYLLTNIALKTDYYKRQPGLFIYLGTDPQLTKRFKSVSFENSLKSLTDKEKMSDSVAAHQPVDAKLLFEQIGDTILRVRREIENGDASRSNERLCTLRMKLEELVNAYNVYTEQKITINEVIPSELKSYFGIPVEAV
jgi:hypothetical protein